MTQPLPCTILVKSLSLFPLYRLTNCAIYWRKLGQRVTTIVIHIISDTLPKCQKCDIFCIHLIFNTVLVRKGYLFIKILCCNLNRLVATETLISRLAFIVFDDYLIIRKQYCIAVVLLFIFNTGFTLNFHSLCHQYLSLIHI